MQTETTCTFTVTSVKDAIFNGQRGNSGTKGNERVALPLLPLYYVQGHAALEKPEEFLSPSSFNGKYTIHNNIKCDLSI